MKKEPEIETEQERKSNRNLEIICVEMTKETTVWPYCNLRSVVVGSTQKK